MAANLHFASYKYGTHDLQRVGVWAVDPSLLKLAEEVDSATDKSAPPEKDEGRVEDRDIETKASRGSSPGGHGYWIIYIHGGAWRDPSNTYTDIVPTIDHLSSRTSEPSIVAYASIDYRLSAHPSHPQDPATTPHTSLRNARHPDHLHDACAAIVFLNRTFGFGSRYILVGHSAGATLAYQAIMRVLDSQSRAMNEQAKRNYKQGRLESEFGHEPKQRNKDKARVIKVLGKGGSDASDIHGEEAKNPGTVAGDNDNDGNGGDDGDDGEWEDDPNWEDVDEGEGQPEAGTGPGTGPRDLPDSFWREMIRKHLTSWSDRKAPAREVSPVNVYPTEEKEDHFTLPQAVVAMSGIYEFQRFNERHNREYDGFLSAVFGDDESKWNDAAPATYEKSFAAWTERKVCVFGWSTQDTVVDELEIIGMTKKVEGIGRCFAEKSRSGVHDAAWKDGLPIAHLVEEALDRIAEV